MQSEVVLGLHAKDERDWRRFVIAADPDPLVGGLVELLVGRVRRVRGAVRLEGEVLVAAAGVHLGAQLVGVRPQAALDRRQPLGGDVRRRGARPV